MPPTARKSLMDDMPKPAAAPSKGGKGGGASPEARKQMLVGAAAVVCILLAGGILGWYYDVFPWQKPKPVQTAPDPMLSSPEYQKQQEQMKDYIKKHPPAGA